MQSRVFFDKNVIEGFLLIVLCLRITVQNEPPVLWIEIKKIVSRQNCQRRNARQTNFVELHHSDFKMFRTMEMVARRLSDDVSFTHFIAFGLGQAMSNYIFAECEFPNIPSPKRNCK